MKSSRKIMLVVFGCAIALLSTNSILGQERGDRVTPRPNADVSLVPVELVNASMDGVAKPLNSPSGVGFNSGFMIPRNASKTIEVLTNGGSVDVHFSHTLPAGVPAGAFEWEQAGAPVPKARGRLRYNGCSGCPASFTIQIRASSGVSSASSSLKLTMTDATGAPNITSIQRDGGTDVVPRFAVSFAEGTYNAADSEFIGVYAGNFKYRLIPETNNASATRVFFTIPRLKPSRNVSVILKNPYGSSTPRDVQLPQQQLENGFGQFNCVNCSTVFGDALINDEFSVRHRSGLLGDSGTDTIPIRTLQTGAGQCDEPDIIFRNARVRWIDGDGNSGNSDQMGTVTVAAQPQTEQPLRAPQNTIRIAWTLKAGTGDQFYQILFGHVDVVGVCQNRVVQ